MPGVQELSSKSQEEKLIGSKGNVVLFFGSQYCGHCQHIKPVIENLASKYPNVKFAHIETTKVKSLNVDQGVPQFVFYQNGHPVGHVLGANESKITAMVQQM